MSRWAMTLGGLSAAALALAGCGTSAPARHFTLQGPAEAPCARAEGNASKGVSLVDLVIPDRVDRPQLVFRSGENGVVVLEQARWAEPLKSGFASVLAARLGRELGCAPVLVRPLGVEDMPWKLSLEVQRFDAEPGRSVRLEAAWTLRHRGGGAARTRTGQVEVALPENTPEAAVAAQSRAVGLLAVEIARELEALAR